MGKCCSKSSVGDVMDPDAIAREAERHLEEERQKAIEKEEELRKQEAAEAEKRAAELERLKREEEEARLLAEAESKQQQSDDEEAVRKAREDAETAAAEEAEREAETARLREEEELEAKRKAEEEERLAAEQTRLAADEAAAGVEQEGVPVKAARPPKPELMLVSDYDRPEVCDPCKLNNEALRHLGDAPCSPRRAPFTPVGVYAARMGCDMGNLHDPRTCKICYLLDLSDVPLIL